MMNARAFDDKNAKLNGRYPTACGECSRRKQKCNKEWPCTHCLARKVPHMCDFGKKERESEQVVVPPGFPSPSAFLDDESLSALDNASRKRKGDDGHDGEPRNSRVADDVDVTLKAMGIGPDPQQIKLSVSVIERSIIPSPGEDRDGHAAELAAALDVVLPRPYTDALIQNFLHGGNYYYYIIYPPQFSDDYSQWWSDRIAGKSVSPELTCLILRICACSAQYLPPNLRNKVRNELARNAKTLSQQFHAAAQRLGGVIPPGKGGLTQIQQIFVSAFWFKSESRWIESWHALGTAIRLAQELGLHQDSSLEGLSEYDAEMRRRIWCLLYLWDWQISLLFGRPLIINHDSCNFRLPQPMLYTGNDGRAPSPFGHMLIQCELIRDISAEFGVLEIPLGIEKTVRLQRRIEAWMEALPAVYALKNTDTSMDGKYSYLPVQRPYLHAVSYALLLIPLKPFVINSVSDTSPPEEERARVEGVDIALKLMDTAEVLFETVYPNDAKFHFSFFSLFDTSTLLCSAIQHDTNSSLPRRDDIIEYIAKALGMLKQLAPITDTAATALKVLQRLVMDLPLT